MNSIWIAVAGFVGAALGSLFTGVVVEYYRQRNRLQLVAAEKRLEIYQVGLNWAAQIGGRLVVLKGQGESPSEDERLQELRADARIWFRESFLYLSRGVAPVLWRAFNTDDEKHVDAAFDIVEKLTDLPSLGGDRWWSFVGQDRK